MARALYAKLPPRARLSLLLGGVKKTLCSQRARKKRAEGREKEIKAWQRGTNSPSQSSFLPFCCLDIFALRVWMRERILAAVPFDIHKIYYHFAAQHAHHLPLLPLLGIVKSDTHQLIINFSSFLKNCLQNWMLMPFFFSTLTLPAFFTHHNALPNYFLLNLRAIYDTRTQSSATVVRNLAALLDVQIKKIVVICKIKSLILLVE